jgi:hypothetical protein
MTAGLAKDLRRKGFHVPAYAELPLGRKPAQRDRGEITQATAAERGMISRHGIGKVLGVR